MSLLSLCIILDTFLFQLKKNHYPTVSILKYFQNHRIAKVKITHIKENWLTHYIQLLSQVSKLRQMVRFYAAFMPL